MSISKNIKKLLVAGAAIIMAASAGASLNNVNAKRRSRYHYRTHRTYRRKARRNTRISKARKPKRTRRRARRARRYRSKARRSSKRNMFSYFTPAEIKHLAKLNGEPVKEFKSDSIGNNQGHIYGPAKAYNMNGFYMILTNYGLHVYAKNAHESVPKAIKLNSKHATKWWHWDGTPTKLNEKVSDKDAIADLNKERAAKGVGPVTQDPVLQFIAEKRAKQVATEPCWPGDPHLSPSGKIQTDVIVQKYHLPYTTASENVGSPEMGAFDMPSQNAKDEGWQWDPTHRAARDNPAMTRAGIDGGVEEFSGND